MMDVKKQDSSVTEKLSSFQLFAKGFLKVNSSCREEENFDF